jgi:hypothetical protein
MGEPHINRGKAFNMQHNQGPCPASSESMQGRQRPYLQRSGTSREVLPAYERTKSRQRQMQELA